MISGKGHIELLLCIKCLDAAGSAWYPAARVYRCSPDSSKPAITRPWSGTPI